MKSQTATYFRDQLNYTLGDEDAAVEHGILREGARQVVAIAGSGSRALPLLSRVPTRLTFVDISPPQLYLTELRVAAARVLSHSGFVAFLGYPPESMSPRQREEAFQKLDLSADARAFLGGLLESHGWQSPLYLGRFERMIQQLSRLNRLFTGRAGQELFTLKTLEEQRDYLASSFPHRAFRLVLLLLGNSTVLNSLLYRGEFPKKNVPGSAYSIYRRIFYKLLESFPARESFFLQMVFLGSLQFPAGNPLECDPQVYAQARRALETVDVSYVCGDVIETVRRLRAADFVFLSDVPTFLPGPREQSCLQELRPGLASGAIVLTRGHLRVSHPDAQGFEVLDSAYQAVLEKEKTQLWSIQIYRLTG